MDLNEIPNYVRERREQANRVAKSLTDVVNTMSNDNEDFIAAMSHQHRTLQQSFTRLCLGWIEHAAKPEYMTDPRNESTKEVCAALMEAWDDFKAKKKAMEEQSRKDFMDHKIDAIKYERFAYDCPLSKQLPTI